MLRFAKENTRTGDRNTRTPQRSGGKARNDYSRLLLTSALQASINETNDKNKEMQKHLLIFMTRTGIEPMLQP